MPALYHSELVALMALPKYKIGDHVRVVQVKITDKNNYHPDTLYTFDAVMGQILEIKEIEYWENKDHSYSISYEFHIGHLTDAKHESDETLYLGEDEIETSL